MGQNDFALIKYFIYLSGGNAYPHGTYNNYSRYKIKTTLIFKT